MSSSFVPDTKGFVSATKVQNFTEGQQEVALENLGLNDKVKSLADLATPASTQLLAMNASGEVVDGTDVQVDLFDCTKPPFNCDPTGVVDATAGLNAFFAHISANDVKTARCNGTFKVATTIFIGPDGPWESTRMATKNIEGNMRLNFEGSTSDTAVVFRNAWYVTWTGIITVDGAGGTLYTSRGNVTGIRFTNVNHSNFDGFFVSQALGDGFVVDSSGTIPCYNNKIGTINASDCGSSGVTGVDISSVIGTWSGRVDSGTSGGFDQLSTITVTNLPPASCDSLSKTLLIDGTPYIVKSINRGSSTVSVFPWILPMATTSGSYRFVYGSGVRFFGTEVAGNVIHDISPTLCGNGLEIACLYGPTIGVLQVHACGAALTVGTDVADAMLGLSISRLYCEVNEIDFLLKTLAAKSVNINSMDPVENSKIRTCAAPTVGVWNAPSPAWSQLFGCSFGLASGLYEFSKPINNGEILDGAATIRVGTDNVSYKGDNFTVFVALSDPALISRLGVDSFRFTVFGTGSNGAPTGTITVTPPTGWRINGGTINANATFSGFPGPAIMHGYMELATQNIVLGKINAALVTHNHAASDVTSGSLEKARQHAQTAYKDELSIFTEGIRLASGGAPWGPGHIYESGTDLVLAGNTGISFRYGTGGVFGGIEIARLTNTVLVGPNYQSSVPSGNNSYLQFTQTGVNSWSFGNRISQDFVLNNGGALAGTDVITVATSGKTTFTGSVVLGVFTVATLPSASANSGSFAQVTDSNSTTNGATVAGSGSNRVPVFSDGTNWIIK